jgi:hypothetical protein
MPPLRHAAQACTDHQDPPQRTAQARGRRKREVLDWPVCGVPCTELAHQVRPDHPSRKPRLQRPRAMLVNCAGSARHCHRSHLHGRTSASLAIKARACLCGPCGCGAIGGAGGGSTDGGVGAAGAFPLNRAASFAAVGRSVRPLTNHETPKANLYAQLYRSAGPSPVTCACTAVYNNVQSMAWPPSPSRRHERHCPSC